MKAGRRDKKPVEVVDVEVVDVAVEADSVRV